MDLSTYMQKQHIQTIGLYTFISETHCLHTSRISLERKRHMHKHELESLENKIMNTIHSVTEQ